MIQRSIRLNGQVQLLSRYIKVATRTTLIIIGGGGGGGVSLLSILGKVFAHILNKRLSWWQEESNKIDEEQSGFRTGYSTMDNVFVLNAMFSGT